MELLGFGEAGYGWQLFIGLLLTLQLALSSYVLAVLIGTFLGMAAFLRLRGATITFKAYYSILTGVPSLLVIMFLYYNVPYLAQNVFGLTLDIGPMAAGIAALSLVYAAYVAEIVRGALSNVPQGQYEATKALSLGLFPTWGIVILPQAGKLAFPGLSNIWIVLLKDTALVSLVGLADLVRVASVAGTVTNRPLLFYATASLIFVLITFTSLSAVQRWNPNRY